MPITALGAAAITAGAQILGSGANAYAQGKMNKKTREWNEQQYWRTRKDSLSDWAMANEYNSPREQMQRFKDAGLNPNLIYGQTNTADAVRSSETPPWNPRAPQMDFTANAALAAYQDIKMQDAQRDLLAEQIKVQQQQQANIAADTALKSQNFKAGTWASENAAKLGELSLQTGQATLSNIEQQTRKSITEQQISLNQDERHAALTSSNLKEAIERIGAIRINNLKTQAETENQRATKQSILSQIDAIKQGIENAKKDGIIKDENIKLLRRGQNPNDPTWLRILGEILDKHFPTPKKFADGVDKQLNIPSWKNRPNWGQ